VWASLPSCANGIIFIIRRVGSTTTQMRRSDAFPVLRSASDWMAPYSLLMLPSKSQKMR
jgi:hypothetical protein